MGDLSHRVPSSTTPTKLQNNPTIQQNPNSQPLVHQKAPTTKLQPHTLFLSHSPRLAPPLKKSQALTQSSLFLSPFIVSMIRPLVCLSLSLSPSLSRQQRTSSSPLVTPPRQQCDKQSSTTHAHARRQKSRRRGVR